MASPSRSQGLCSRTEEEMDAQMETVQCSSNDNCGENEKKEDVKNNNAQETEDPFKKPALFAAPSRATKRVSVSTSAEKKPPSEPDSSPMKEDTSDASDNTPADGDTSNPDDASVSTPDNHSDTENTPEGGTHPDEEKTVAPIKTKEHVKPRLPVNVSGLPAGHHPPLPYTEPPWGGVAADVLYSLVILKSGTLVDTIPLTQSSYFVVGRLPVCDVSLEHPSISRYHAVIQYRGEASEGDTVGEARGFYGYDLGSTHGTFVNKNKMPPKTYVRLRVGHVLKFGGSTRLFILEGPKCDEEAESELTVTELRERARKQRAELEKRMMGEGSDEEEEKEGERKGGSAQGKSSSEDSGCSWGIAEEAAPDEDESEENPFATEFQEDQEAAYLKDPKKALQGFYDREGEELEFEYEDKSHGSWLCRVKLPVDDALGRQLVAEVTHTGKKKEALIQCSLEACRILEARGLLRQEAVSRKRKKKNWEDEDFYDSDDDNFLDRTGAVEKKRQQRMKKAGKIEERPDTYDSLVAKLTETEKQLAETEKKLSDAGRDGSHSSSEDPLDAFMSKVQSETGLDGVERRKLHVHATNLRKEAQRLRKLVELTRPAQMPSLQTGSGSGSSEPQKKKSLPLFGAMKGGSKFKLKTGTIGKLPTKRADLPAELFNMKGLPPGGEEEEEEEEAEEEKDNSKGSEDMADVQTEPQEPSETTSTESSSTGLHNEELTKSQHSRGKRIPQRGRDTEESDETTEHAPQPGSADTKQRDEEETVAKPSLKKSGKKKMMGPSRPPVALSGEYPEDDPDYCVWVPPTGQSGDGRTHLNEKYGY